MKVFQLTAEDRGGARRDARSALDILERRQREMEGARPGDRHGGATVFIHVNEPHDLLTDSGLVEMLELLAKDGFRYGFRVVLVESPTPAGTHPAATWGFSGTLRRCMEALYPTVVRKPYVASGCGNYMGANDPPRYYYDRNA